MEKNRVSLGFGGLYASTGDHIGHFYQSSEEEKSVLVSFLKAGLDAKEKCICLISASRRDDVLEALRADGVDVEGTLAAGDLIVDQGSGDPQQLRDMLKEALKQVPEKYSMLRWAGVMSWALEKTPTTEKLMEWETHCNVTENPAVVFLCQYELTTFRGNVVMDAMKTHPICIISSVIHQNPYYANPEVYMEELRGRKATTLT